MDSRQSSRKCSKGKEKIGSTSTQMHQVVPYQPSHTTTTTTTIDIEAQKRILARFVYENNISPHALASRSFRNVLNLGGRGDSLRDCIPTFQEVRERILDYEHREISAHVENVKQSWPLTGCSVIFDGWDDVYGKKIVNVLVDCPKGVVYLRSFEVSSSLLEDFDKMVEVFEGLINEVGENNVLQVITHSASESWLDKLRDYVKETHRPIFWNVSATHCLCLILERVAATIHWVHNTITRAKRITRLIYNNKFLLNYMVATDTMRNYGHTLVVPSKIKAAMPFLTLEKMLLRKNDIEDLFISGDWYEMSLRAKEVVDFVVKNNAFWNDVTLVVKGVIPIVKVLGLFSNGNIDNNIPQMGILYETMDQMKETIQDEIGKRKAREIWGVIDDIWNQILHSPIHAAGYYLNPKIFYTEDFGADPEVMEGMLSTILKIGGDQMTQRLITEQLKIYENGYGEFRQGIEERNNFPPVEWWKRYGNHCQELQSLAVKVLGLTCNGASSYELKKDYAEQQISEKEIPISYNWLKKVSYVAYNVSLRKVKQPEFKFDLCDNCELDPHDDWIVGQY